MNTVEYYLNQLPDGYREFCLKYADKDLLKNEAYSIPDAIMHNIDWSNTGHGRFFAKLNRFYCIGGEMPPLPVDLLQQKFAEYNEQHPEVYKTFEKMALELISKGIKHYGSKAIIEAIRYHTIVSEGKEFKINNNITPMFARVFESKHPEHEGFFEKRASKLN